MRPSDLWRATKQWAPFAARTVAYGTVSIALGPVTERKASLWAMQRWCRSSMKALGIVADVEGLENVPTTGAYVYCSNHQSIVDIIVLGATLPGDYKWAAKRSLMKIPFLGWHLTIAGHVPVDRRSGARAAAEVIKLFEVVLRKGNPLLVFPEGTRSEDGQMRPFKNGGFYAAVRAGVPVIPVAVNGTHSLMKRGARDTGDEGIKRIQVRLGPPIYPKRKGRESALVADMRDRTFDAVAQMLESEGGTVVAPRPRPRAAATRRASEGQFSDAPA